MTTKSLEVASDPQFEKSLITVIEKIYDFRVEATDAYEKDDSEVDWKRENDEMVVNVTVQCIGSARVTNIERKN